jgi:hypothetical protein
MPSDKLVHLGEDDLDILGIREERRELKLVLRQSEIRFGSGTAVVLRLAEAAPFTAEEVAVSGKGKLRSGLQYLVRPAVQVIFGKSRRC